MKSLLYAVAALTLFSCGRRNDTKIEHNDNRPDVAYVSKYSVKDSMILDKNLGKVVERTYSGVIPAADGPGIRYDLTLWNQEKSGTGAYALSTTYLEADNGKDKTSDSTGKWYTLRGDATDKNATVFQLVPSNKNDDKMNFLVQGRDSLTMLNASLERANSKLNYTLTRR